ncbi:hypothetical protein RJT34_31822 [Clitoria ternatea]|uniref:Uncharacterized protein n=1 Tax=Clitoria ternatea TaxID=43366 RepID=A0AAN9I365_CLITE
MANPQPLTKPGFCSTAQNKNEKLERENAELKNMKRKWDTNSVVFTEVKMENNRIAKAVKHYREHIEFFWAENNKLALENMDLEGCIESLELTATMNEGTGPLPLKEMEIQV